ncbi:hypothetical protein Leryth_014057 [Lithospermum erythrorhizon]|nr:hypothetical protein Leryth_014057 [Lithospermum erythrorhizon]
MVVPSNGDHQSLIYNIRLSSVGPGKVTGQDVTHEPSEMDLVMKLHYLNCVYYFPSQAFEGLTVINFKEHTFSWLNNFYSTCGRFRRSETGRPYIKCNDCGMRFIEAECGNTLEEWCEMLKNDASLENLLVRSQVIGPEMAFSPPTLLQLTKFKCGGTSLGLRWAHVLGDAFSVSDYINALGKVISGQKPSLSINMSQSDMPKNVAHKKVAENPLSVKRIASVGDHWISPTDAKMEVFSLHISSQELTHLQEKMKGDFSAFETISALIWQCIARIRENNGLNVVTLCKKDAKSKGNGVVSNDQIISVVKADFSIMDANLTELAMLMKNGGVDERGKIEQAVENDQGVSDFVVYGSNLTFLDLDKEESLYGFEIQGNKPVLVSYGIDGVGENGAVLVLPGERNGDIEGNGGKIVKLILPEDQLVGLKSELKKNGLLI